MGVSCSRKRSRISPSGSPISEASRLHTEFGSLETLDRTQSQRDEATDGEWSRESPPPTIRSRYQQKKRFGDDADQHRRRKRATRSGRSRGSASDTSSSSSLGSASWSLDPTGHHARAKLASFEYSNSFDDLDGGGGDNDGHEGELRDSANTRRTHRELQQRVTVGFVETVFGTRYVLHVARDRYLKNGTVEFISGYDADKITPQTHLSADEIAYTIRSHMHQHRPIYQCIGWACHHEAAGPEKSAEMVDPDYILAAFADTFVQEIILWGATGWAKYASSLHGILSLSARRHTIHATVAGRKIYIAFVGEFSMARISRISMLQLVNN